VKLSVKEVTRILRFQAQVARWVREQNLPAMVVAGHLRFHGSDLLEWATARKMSVPPELFCNAETPRAPLAS
jgi:hypothetical protein